MQTEAEAACPRVVLAADHGGVRLKDALARWLSEHGYQARDLGTVGEESVDYPDYAEELVRQMTAGHFERGVLICKTGIGMSIAANRLPGIRAALVADLETAVTSRTHNDSNILVLSGRAFDEPRFGEAQRILEQWLATPFEGGRHQRRLNKIEQIQGAGWARVGAVDPEIAQALLGELERERQTIELIASENFASRAVMEAQGSVLTNKYAEGLPGKRWYCGCEFVDKAESLAIERARRLFGGDHVNVQPHSGSSANMAVYFALLNPGDTIMAMNLAHGGHLTHGHELNFSGRFFKIVPYGVSRETERIDYDALAEQARAARPRMILAGASAYSRIIDFPRLRQIADDVGALLVVDMAHIAGLVAAGEHPSPVPFCDVVTTTTHKTLRGPRGGLIICREAHAKAIDTQVFPGIQGGPLMHVIAAKAVCFHEALQPAFRLYQQQIRANARRLAEAFQAEGVRIVSGGTDNHCFLVDLTSVSAELTGRDLATRLDQASITVNKNAIPFDQRGPFHASGIRIGTPAVTTRGMKEPQMSLIASWIAQIARAPKDDALLTRVRDEVHGLTAQYPLYPEQG